MISEKKAFKFKSSSTYHLNTKDCNIFSKAKSFDIYIGLLYTETLPDLRWSSFRQQVTVGSFFFLVARNFVWNTEGLVSLHISQLNNQLYIDEYIELQLLNHLALEQTYFILLPNIILLHGDCFPPSTALSGNLCENRGTLKLSWLEVVFLVWRKLLL